MQIQRIPALSDNYIFLLYEPSQKIAAVVDPADATPVLRVLETLDAKLVAIFNTHHHRDHVGGNQQLMQQFPEVVVYGGAEDRDRIPGQQVFLEEGDRIQFGDHTAEVLFVPGHTKAHIAYYFPPSVREDNDRNTRVANLPFQGEANPKSKIQNPQSNDELIGDLFCGDTLFAGGCGRLFEGTPQQMVNSLSKIRQLPDQTRVWCAHEYTLKNLQFALTVDGENGELSDRFQQVKIARRQNQATIPSILGIEKRTNPFLRWDVPTLQHATKSQDSIQTFARLRGMKDQF